MEGVPRLPMLNFELKSSHEFVEFTPALKSYIQEFYHENPDSYSKECSELEQLRQMATTVTMDFVGCSVLKKYFSQLKILESRFPMGHGDPIVIPFTWEDLFTHHLATVTDIKFEQANILYNIGALHSMLGSMDNRTTPEGMKVSCTHFQCAAWAFQHLKETFESFDFPDFNRDLLSFQSMLMLAQAQECILEKSMTDNRKSSITAKVASQIVDYYKMATKHLDACNISFISNSKKYKEWKKRMELKTKFYDCVTYYYLGSQAEEQQKWGERLAYLQVSLDRLNETMKLNKSDDAAIEESLKFTMDVVGGKYNSAKKDNDFVYHEKIPAIETLPEVKGASLVKGIPLNHNDPEVSGPDIFKKLVPLEAHKASSLYSEEKAKLLRKVGSDVDEKDEELNQYLAGLQLDSAKIFPEHQKLPEILLEKCAAISVKPDAVKGLIDAMQSLSGISTDVEGNIKDINDMLDAEEKKEKEMQEAYGTKHGPNVIMEEIRKDCGKCMAGLTKASESNQELHKLMRFHISNLRLLSGPLDELQKSLPSPDIQQSAEDEATMHEMKRLMDKVDEMKNQRQSLMQQLRDQIHKDDITQVLVISKHDSNQEAFFSDQLNKHNKLVGFISQNLGAQANILHALTEANAKYARIRKDITETNNRREATIRGMVQSYDVYEDLLNKTQKGIDFYGKLESNVNRLVERARALCRIQQEERDKVVERLAPKAPAPARPTAPKPGQQPPPMHSHMNVPAPPLPDADPQFPGMPADMAYPSLNLPTGYLGDAASEGPKLKDFLPLMKPRTFGPKSQQTGRNKPGDYRGDLGDPSSTGNYDHLNQNLPMPTASFSLPGSHSASPVHIPQLSASHPSSPLTVTGEQRGQPQTSSGWVSNPPPVATYSSGPCSGPTQQQWGPNPNISPSSPEFSATPHVPSSSFQGEVKSSTHQDVRSTAAPSEQKVVDSLPNTTINAFKTDPYYPATAGSHAQSAMPSAYQNGYSRPAGVSGSTDTHSYPAGTTPADSSQHYGQWSAGSQSSVSGNQETSRAGNYQPESGAAQQNYASNRQPGYPSSQPSFGQSGSTPASSSAPAPATVSSAGNFQVPNSLNQFANQERGYPGGPLPGQSGTSQNVSFPAQTSSSHNPNQFSSAGSNQNIPVGHRQNLTNQDASTFNQSYPAASFQNTASQQNIQSAPHPYPGSNQAYSVAGVNQYQMPFTQQRPDATDPNRSNQTISVPSGYATSNVPFHGHGVGNGAVPSGVASSIFSGQPLPNANTSSGQLQYQQNAIGAAVNQFHPVPSSSNVPQMSQAGPNQPAIYGNNNYGGGFGGNVGNVYPGQQHSSNPAISYGSSSLPQQRTGVEYGQNQTVIRPVPQQGTSMPQQGTSMPLQGTSMPQQGTSMPQQGTSMQPMGQHANYSEQQQQLQQQLQYQQQLEQQRQQQLELQRQQLEQQRQQLEQQQRQQQLEQQRQQQLEQQRQQQLEQQQLEQQRQQQLEQQRQHQLEQQRQQQLEQQRQQLEQQRQQQLEQQRQQQQLQQQQQQQLQQQYQLQQQQQQLQQQRQVYAQPLPQQGTSIQTGTYAQPSTSMQHFSTNQNPGYLQSTPAQQYYQNASTGQQMASTATVGSQYAGAVAGNYYAGTTSGHQFANTTAGHQFVNTTAGQQQWQHQNMPTGSYPASLTEIPASLPSPLQPSKPVVAPAPQLGSTPVQTNVQTLQNPVSGIVPNEAITTSTSALQESEPHVLSQAGSQMVSQIGSQMVSQIGSQMVSQAGSQMVSQTAPQPMPLSEQPTLPEPHHMTSQDRGKGDRKNSIASVTSLDELLSDLPSKVSTASENLLIPKVVTAEDLKRQKEEEAKKNLKMSTRDPYTDIDVLGRFVAEVEKLRKQVDGLCKETLSKYTPLEKEWKGTEAEIQLLLKSFSRFQRLFPIPSWMVRGRAFHHQNLTPTFLWIDNCLMELNEEQEKMSKSSLMAIARCYPLKNRFPDIMPFDHSRVKLVGASDDYINASNLASLSVSSPAVIATQAPLPATFSDFWQMVYDYSTEIIVMLCSELEPGGKNHCYWPSDKGQPLNHGNFVISLQSIRTKSAWTERIITLSHKTTPHQSRSVIHLHFQNWPPSGVPESPETLLQFINEVHSFYLQQRNLMKPVIVHCSNGIGRTGAFCVVYTGMQEINQGQGIINIPEVVLGLRRQRKFMVQHKEQLKFCYDAILLHSQDLLKKRGILNTKSSTFSEKGSHSSDWTHSRHPSDDSGHGHASTGIVQSASKVHTNFSTSSDVHSSSGGHVGALDSLHTVSDKLQNYSHTDWSHTDRPQGGAVVPNPQGGAVVPNPQGSAVLPNSQSGSFTHSRSSSSGSGPNHASVGVNEEPSPQHQPCTTISEQNVVDAVLPAADGPTPVPLLPASLAELQNPKTFRMDSTPPAKKKISKASFTNQSGSLVERTARDPNDPLSQLDPLWTLKK